MASIDLLLWSKNTTSALRPQSLRGHLRSACSKLVNTSDRLPTVLPNLCTGVGSTVISRFMTGISAGPPQMLLRCQTLPSMWTLGKDKPVIPGVPFIR